MKPRLRKSPVLQIRPKSIHQHPRTKSHASLLIVSAQTPLYTTLLHRTFTIRASCSIVLSFLSYEVEFSFKEMMLRVTLRTHNMLILMCFLSLCFLPIALKILLTFVRRLFSLRLIYESRRPFLCGPFLLVFTHLQLTNRKT